MTLETHRRSDTIGHEHMSMLARTDNGNDLLYFMLVQCRDGRCFLKSEFNDGEFDQFEDVYKRPCLAMWCCTRIGSLR
jgi:hypothetical protein